MSINDPQWGNSHRPEQKDPEQVPEQAGTEPVQPEVGSKASDTQNQSPVVTSAEGSPQLGGPPEGPPDLEVLWQQLVHNVRCKIAALLRREPPALPQSIQEEGTTPGVSTDEPFGWQALSLKSWLIGVSLLISAWLMSGFYLVDANQRGVLSRFGVIVSTEDPGWHWRWPYPLESVRLVNVTNDRTLEVGVPMSKREAPLMLLTSDQNLVGVGYAVVYQVKDPVAYLSHIEAPGELLSVIAETTMRQSVAMMPLATIQTVKSTDGTTNTLLDGMRQQMQESLDALNAGILIKTVEIKDVVLPSQVVHAIKQAEQDEQTQIKAVRDAQSQAGESVINARMLANHLQEESTEYAQALDVAVTRLNASNPKPDVSALLNQVSIDNLALRKQYPLVFDSYADLVARTQEAGAQPKRSIPQSVNGVGTPQSSQWRDRDVIRSRDRVDRPGAGL